jgi:hypothetical protein
MDGFRLYDSAWLFGGSRRLARVHIQPLQLVWSIHNAMYDARHKKCMMWYITASPDMKSKRKKQPFSIRRYLATTGPGRSALDFQAGQAIFYQGDAADAVYYIRHGAVKLTAGSKTGREAVIGLLKAGDFFGERCLVGKPKHMTTARAMASTSLLVLKRKEMIRVLHEEPAFRSVHLAHPQTQGAN